jgi:phage-related protein
MADRTIDFVLNAKDNASRAFHSVSSAAGTLASKAMPALKEFGKGLAIGAGIGAFDALVGGFGSAVNGARDAAKQAKLLDNQIKNLGPSGKAAFGSASEFAEKLSVSIGKDDDDIRAVQTKLASFPSAFAQGSLGAEAMRRATTAAFDLEAIGIGAAQSNIIGIGKALDNPIKGMTALSKAGVSFSEEQKVAIKQAMEQGDLAKAQSIILAGIESNAKGAAQAGVDNIEKLKVSMGNLAEGAVGLVLPALQSIAGFITTTVVPAVQSFLAGFNAPAAAAGLQSLGAKVTEIGGVIIAGFTAMWAVVGPVLSQIWTIIQTQVIPAFSAFVTAAQPVVVWFANILGPTVLKVMAAVGQIISGALKIISGLFNVFAGLLSGDWRRMWQGIQQILSGAWSIIKGLFSAGLAAVKALFTTAVGALRAIADQIVNGLKSAFDAGVAKLKSSAKSIVDGIVSTIKGAISSVTGIGRDIVNGLASGIRNAAGAVMDAARSVVDKIPASIRKIMGISSPSKVTRALGRNIVDGLIQGMTDRDGALSTRAAMMTGLLEPSGGPDGFRGGYGGNVTVINVSGAIGNERFLAATLRSLQETAQRRGYGLAGA